MGCDGFPKLGLGTWMMGGRDMPDPSNDDAADIAAIRRAVEAGISHIDTAEYYADGKAEKLVGRMLCPVVLPVWCVWVWIVLTFILCTRPIRKFPWRKQRKLLIISCARK